MTGLAAMPYPALLRMFDAGSAAGQHYALGTRWLPELPELPDDAIAALAEGAATRTSAESVLMVHQFHGAAARVAPDATAFAVRRDHLLTEVIGAWAPEEDPAPHRDWIQRTPPLAPGALPRRLSEHPRPRGPRPDPARLRPPPRPPPDPQAPLRPRRCLLRHRRCRLIGLWLGTSHRFDRPAPPPEGAHRWSRCRFFAAAPPVGSKHSKEMPP